MTNLPANEVVTEPCRLAFPSLFKSAPRSSVGKSDRMTYQATLLIPPNVDKTPFVGAIKAQMVDQFGKPFKLIGDANPLHKCDDRDPRPEGYDDGWIYIGAHSGYPVGVFDQRKEPILDAKLFEVDPMTAMARAEARIFAGCWCRFHLRAFGWEYASKRGISFSLEAVQLVREGDRLGGSDRSGSAFDVIDVDDDTLPADVDDDMADLFG